MPHRTSGATRLLRLLVLALLLAVAAPARAERYNFLHYLPTDGLSQSQVTALLQDSQGYLWVGTLAGGLNRFDGQRFRAYRHADGLSAVHIRNLLEVDGHLYVGTRQGLFRRTGDRFEAIEAKSSTPLDIYALVHTAGSGVIAATEAGLFRLDQGVLSPDPRTALLPAPVVRDIAADHKGILWAIGKQWIGSLTDTFTPLTVPEGLELTTVAVDPRGGAWVGTRRGLHHTTETGLEPHTRAHLNLGLATSSLYLDRDRVLWVGTRKGAIGLKDGKARPLGTTEGFPAELIRSTTQDREGNLFFGTDGAGLLQLPRQPFSMFDIPGLTDYAPISTLVDKPNRRFVATLGQGLWMVERDRATLIGEENGLTSLDCTSLLLHAPDALWVGTNVGLYEVNPATRKASFNRYIGAVSVIGQLAVDGERYVATEKGLWTYDGKRWRRYGLEEGLPSEDLFSLLATKQGLWVGTHDAGAFRWDPQTRQVVERLQPGADLPSGNVISMWEDKDGSIWFGTDQGLVHRTGDRTRVITSADGLPEDTINFVTRDPQGDILWVGTNRGLAALVDGAWRIYSHRQGLPDDETNSLSASWDAEGRLWAGTARGYAVLASSPPPTNAIPPLVHIEGVWEQGKALDPRSNPTLPHDQNTLRIDFVGLSLTDPTRVRYRYRLSGLENEWLETTQRQVRYPALRPGAYLFEVSATNNDGLWAPDPARFSFEIQPPWWETWWFRAVQVALIFLSGVGVYGLRATSLRRQKHRLELLVAERTRELQDEKEKSERLLLNILPAPIASELKEKGVANTRLYSDVTILFTDFQDFTRMASTVSPEQLVDELNEVFAAFDDICRAHRLEKLKTIGDAFMAAGGLPVENRTHPIDAVEAAIDMQEYLEARSEDPAKIPFRLRIGLHTGPVVAGVIGKWKFAYDIWGDAVNTAARMESASLAGEINLSRSTYDRVKSHFVCEARGQVLAKGKGALEMFFVRGRRNAA